MSVNADREIKVLTFLRALSIALVLISHNPFFDFKIGVIGVDIFFLISGYLITAQFTRFQDSSTFLPSLGKFYFRRARRILPSAIATLIITLLVFNFTTSIEYFQTVKDSVLPALGFYANVHQSDLHSSYFQTLLLNPLASYWSLSIEEQIYFIFPLLLVLFTVVVKKRVVLPLILLTASFPVLLLPFDGKYYSLISRIFPFALGSLLFFIKDYRPKFRLSKLFYLVILVIVLIIFNNFKMDSYPDIRVLLPLLLTSYLILSNTYIDKVNPKIINFVGVRSYNIYLAYLPVYTLLSLKMRSPLYFFPALLLTFIIAQLLYTLDQFFRYKILTPKKLLPALILELLVLLAVYNLPSQAKADPMKSVNITSTKELVEVLDQSITKGYPILSADKYQANLDYRNIFKVVNGEPNQPCNGLMICEVSVDYQPKSLTILVADSTGDPISPLLSKLAIRDQSKLIWFNLTGCDPSGIPLDDYNITDQYTTANCQKFYALLEPTLKDYSSKGKVNIVYEQASSPFRTLDRKALTPEVKDLYFDKTMSMLKQYSNNITVISEVPFNPTQPIECLSANHKLTSSCVFTPVDSLNNYLNKANQEYAQTHNLKYINLRDYLCLENKCPIVIAQTLAYRDSLHTTTAYLEKIESLLSKKISLLTR